MRRGVLRRSRRAQSGSGLLEVAISGAVVVTFLGVAATGSLRATQARQDTMGRVDVERRARASLEAILDRVADCSLSAIAENLTTASGSDRLTFRRTSGWDAAAQAATLGPQTVLSMDADPQDPVNGVDDDKDGVIDQRMVTIRQGGGPVTVLARNVLPLLEGETANSSDDNANGLADEPGFVVSRDGLAVTVRLSLRRRVPDGSLRTVSVSGTVRVAP